jgi:ATP-dependent RNA helicase TDRD9
LILERFPNHQNFEIIILHSTLTTNNTGTDLLKTNNLKRRIIVATNIAESSITIPDVAYVIDYCLTKEITYNH